PFKCWKKGGHGSIDLRHAIEQSCDVYFYTVANLLGIDKINKWATALGLGVLTGVDLPNEVQGLVPSTEWKREKMHEKWYAGETISVGIGQGQVSVTPVSMAVYMATLANGGTRVTPHAWRTIFSIRTSRKRIIGRFPRRRPRTVCTGISRTRTGNVRATPLPSSRLAARGRHPGARPDRGVDDLQRYRLPHRRRVGA